MEQNKNIKKVTSFTHHVSGEGSRISATYSEITPDGIPVKSNTRFNLIVVPDAYPEVQSAIDTINQYVHSKLPD